MSKGIFSSKVFADYCKDHSLSDINISNTIKEKFPLKQMEDFTAELPDEVFNEAKDYCKELCLNFQDFLLVHIAAGILDPSVYLWFRSLYDVTFKAAVLQDFKDARSRKNRRP